MRAFPNKFTIDTCIWNPSLVVVCLIDIPCYIPWLHARSRRPSPLDQKRVPRGNSKEAGSVWACGFGSKPSLMSCSFSYRHFTLYSVATWYIDNLYLTRNVFRVRTHKNVGFLNNISIVLCFWNQP